jgi:hypothetical protein
MARAQASAPDLFPSPGREPSSSSPAESSETEAPFWRHVLPKNLDAAIRQLSDQELDRLVSAALGERARRKNRLCLKVTGNDMPKPSRFLCLRES